MNELFAEKSIVLKDVNDDALFSCPGRCPDTIFEAYFKLREEQAYLEGQKYVMKLRKKLPRLAQIPPLITIELGIGGGLREKRGGLGRSPSLYGTLDLNADMGRL